jgi:hypothetical protein
MRHRSVIAFILIAAALFAAPQISHDLLTFKSTLGARLRGELMNALLSLPSDGGSVAPASRRAETLLASCVRAKADAQAVKSKKNDSHANAESRSDAAPRMEARAADSPREQLAMVFNPSRAPEAWRAELSRGNAELFRNSPDAVVGRAAGSLRRGRTEGEVSMIIPPGSGIDPLAFADSHAFESTVRDGALQKRKVAEELRRVAFVAARFDGKNIEWQKPGDEALRKLNETLPGTYEFRLNRDGATRKVLKGRRTGSTGRPCTAPRAPQAPGQVAVIAPVLLINAQSLPASE